MFTRIVGHDLRRLEILAVQEPPMSEMKSNQWPMGMQPKPTQSADEAKKPRKKRRASEKQLQFARDLGLNVPNEITAAEIGVLIDAALEDERADLEPTVMPDGLNPWLRVLLDATPHEMVVELQRRGMRAILLSWPAHSDSDCTLSCGGLTVDEAKAILALNGHKLMRERDPNYDALYREIEE